METIKTKGILCAIDISETSQQALQWSVKLSKQLSCDLTVLYTYRLVRNISGEIIAWKKKMEEDAMLKFVDLENYHLKGMGINYEFKIEVGFIADRIEDYTRKNTVSLLVMDKNVCTRHKDTFDDLVEHMNIPLVLIP